MKSIALTTVLLTATVASLAAQPACIGGHLQPDLGFDALVCTGCLSSFMHDGKQLPRFTSMPAVRGVRPTISAASSPDLFRDGDTVLTINGRPIVSYGAAILLARWQPGKLSVRLRRAGIPIGVTVTPAPVCIVNSRTLDAEEVSRRALTQSWMAATGVLAARSPYVETGPASGSYTKRGSPPEAPTSESVKPTDELRLPHAKVRCIGKCIWDRVGLGALLSCDRCLSRTDASGTQYWFRDFPVIVELTSNGFADRVGLRPLDSLVAIDGVSVLAAGGALRFKAPPHDARVTVEWSRAGRRMTGTAPFGAPVRTKIR